MGFDPTVQRVRVTDGNNVWYSYRYRVKDQESGKVEVFQTIGDPISESAAYRISSRATRAWEVKKMVLDDNGDPSCDEEGNPMLEEDSLVVKDKWLYVGSLLERDIQNKIFDALGDDAKDARQYFLTIHSEEIIQIGGENACDDVTPVCVSKIPADWTIPQDTQAVIPQKIQLCQERASQSTLAAPRPPYTARMHVRTVFRECCQTVFELTDFRSLLLCLLGCVRGLCTSRMLLRQYLIFLNQR